MMTVDERLSQLVEVLPDETSVTLPVRTVREWLNGASRVTPVSTFVADLTIEQIAEKLDRKASTVRGWLNAGLFDGAYKLRDREWRIPELSLHAFQHAQRERTPRASLRRASMPRTTGDWKK